MFNALKDAIKEKADSKDVENLPEAIRVNIFKN
jgi:hypothetical protein